MEDISAGNTEIITVYRLNRFVNKIKKPTNKIAVVFRTNILPENIQILRVRCHVEPYYSKLLFCEKCLRYNHKTTSCKSSAKKCGNCCSFGHDIGTCSYQEFCFHCKHNHRVNDDVCNERFKQNHIKHIMAHQKLSYQEIQDEYDFFKNRDFNLFERIDEFPNVHESFSKLKKDKPIINSIDEISSIVIPEINNKVTKNKIKYKFKKLSNNNIRQKATTNVSNIPSKRKRLAEELTEVCGVVTHNPHKVSEFEALQSQILEKTKNIMQEAKIQINKNKVSFKPTQKNQESLIINTNIKDTQLSSVTELSEK